MPLPTELFSGLESDTMAQLPELRRSLRGRTVLFLSPTPALSPLLQAQGVPHMRELAAQFGIRFILFTMENSARTPAYEQAAAELRNKLASWGIEWLSMRNGRMPLFPNSTSDVLRGIPQVAHILRSRAVDLVHCRSYVPAFIMLALRPLFSVPWIFDLRGFYPDELVRDGQWPAASVAHKASLWLERRSFEFAAATVVVTDRQHQRLLTRWPRADRARIAVIRNCADTGRFAPNPEMRQLMRRHLGVGPKPLLVWSASSIRKVHAPLEVLTFAKLCRDALGSRLLILTRTADADGMVRAAGFLAGEYNIVSAEPEKVPAYLNAADAGIAFIVQDHEGPGIKFAEYLAIGLPVIANGANAEWCGVLRNKRCGVVVNDFSSSEYGRVALSLPSLLAEPGIRERCREVALTDYSLEGAVAAYSRLYQRLMAAGFRK